MKYHNKYGTVDLSPKYYYAERFCYGYMLGADMKSRMNPLIDKLQPAASRVYSVRVGDVGVRDVFLTTNTY